jgi:membrane protein YqaA with SNARE-associated domain
MKPFRKLYDWTLHWAETPYGPTALFIMSFAESSFFPIPPDVLLIALCIGAVKKSFKFALQCSIASVLGGLFGYAIGHWAWGVPPDYSPVAQFFFTYIPGFTVDRFQQVSLLYKHYDFWIVFTAGFTPIPYKVFTIASGVFNMNLFMFLLASGISRTARFFLVAGLIRIFGKQIRSFIDSYFNLLSIVFVILLIGGFYLAGSHIKHAADDGPPSTNMVEQVTNAMPDEVQE